MSQYQTRGAFAYLSDEQKVYARFFWQQTGQDNYRLLLLNPLGSTELELNAKPGEAQITDNKGQHYYRDRCRRDDWQADRDAYPAEQPAPVDPRPAG